MTQIPTDLRFLLDQRYENHKFKHIVFQNPGTRECHTYYTITRKQRWNLPMIFSKILEYYFPDWMNEESIEITTMRGPVKEDVEKALRSHGLEKAIVFRVSINDEAATVYLTTCCQETDCPICSDIEGINFDYMENPNIWEQM